jgi:hypothetical protein
MNKIKVISDNFLRMMTKCKMWGTAAFIMLLSFQASSTTYFSRTNGGNWNSNATWSTVGYGNSTNTGTFPKTGDAAFIGDGYTIKINTTAKCANINVGEGRSGVLQFMSGGNYILTVTGNITVDRRAKFYYNTAAAATHTLLVAGDFINNGTVDFYYATGQVVNLILNGNSNSTVSGVGTWDLNNVTFQKAASTNILSINSLSFENAVKTFAVTTGTYIHNNTSSYSINPAINFTIGQNVKFQIPKGTMWFSSAADILTLQGSLYVNGGTVNVGSTAGLKGLATDKNGAAIPYLEVTSGTLNVYGGISYAGGSALDPFSFNMTGGTININTGTTGSNTHLFCVNDVASSSFNMSAGTITIEKPNNTPGFNNFDVGICGNNGITTTTGGVIQFGTAATPSGSYFSFVPLPNATYPHFMITGNLASVVTLGTSVNDTSNFRLLSLFIDSNKGFDIRSVAGTAGDGKQMTLTITEPATSNAFINNGTFYQRYSNVIFSSGTAQGIGGSSVTTFWYLSINNPNNIILNAPANINSYLNLISGNLITTNTNILTCAPNANCDLGSSTSYVDGPMVHTVGTNVQVTKIFPFGKSNVYRPVLLTVKHATTASVTYRAELFNSPAATLPFSLPPTISQISAVRYVKFTRQAVVNFSYGGIQMYYGSDDAVQDYQSLLVAQDDGFSQWRNLGGTATSNVMGNITSSTFSTFTNYFALANPPGGQNPLPVSLIAYTAKQNSKNVNIDWSTATEINCDYFTVERSTNNKDYKTIGMVNGAGNSTSLLNYSTIDENPFKGISYYRLRQTDYDGKEVVYPPVSVNYLLKTEFTAYPTVSNGDGIHLTNTANDLHTYSIAVQNMSGTYIPASLKSNFGGMDLFIDDSYIKSDGVYIISATRDNEVLKEKVIITKNNY